jgi:hypothetical protein
MIDPVRPTTISSTFRSGSGKANATFPMKVPIFPESLLLSPGKRSGVLGLGSSSPKPALSKDSILGEDADL